MESQTKNEAIKAFNAAAEAQEKPEREEETSTAETKYKAEYRRRIEELSRLMKEMDE